MAAKLMRLLLIVAACWSCKGPNPIAEADMSFANDLADITAADLSGGNGDLAKSSDMANASDLATRDMAGPPRDMAARDMAGPPGDMAGRDMAGPPRDMASRDMAGPPRDMAGPPRDMAGPPRDMTSSPDMRMAACAAPADCTMGTPYCCAKVSIGAGVPPMCPITATTSCQTSCNGNIPLMCPAMGQVRLCSATADCAGDPGAYRNCCSIPTMAAYKVCITDLLKAVIPGVMCI